MSPAEQLKFPRDEISLTELLQVLRGSRRLIIIVTAVTSLAAIAAAIILPPRYEASIIVAPVSTNESQLGSLGSLASQFSGLASLAGISLSGGTQRSESLAVLESRALTERYVESRNLLPILFASDWDAQKKQWKDTRPGEIPTLWKANKRFEDDIRSVSDGPQSGLVTLTITWKDPKLAAQWANDLIGETNSYLRAKAIAESERNIAYLRDLITNTDLVTIRDAISSVVENEINKQMIARGTEEYALKVLDPAVTPERPELLRKLGLVLGGVLGGLFLSVLFVLVRASIR